MKRTLGISIMATVALFASACGSGEEATQTETGTETSTESNSSAERGGTSTITFALPDGVSEVADFSPTDGWTKSYTDNQESPTIVIRVSDDLGRTPDADSTVGVLRGEAMLNGAYGPDWSPGEVEKLEVDNADIGIEYSFSTKQKDADITGTWFLLSHDESEKVAGVEVIGTDVSPALVSQIRDSLEYTP
ncbi:hypothetical protein [Corynebacterium riegelii]|uniref:hypothetical protein n=1 Tax=Corynebacterium riegelii TaxID=156976 RepID=UPI00288B8AEA|nr:hypothetical protein [Corynebacterium riegelii]